MVQLCSLIKLGVLAFRGFKKTTQGVEELVAEQCIQIPDLLGNKFIDVLGSLAEKTKDARLSPGSSSSFLFPLQAATFES